MGTDVSDLLVTNGYRVRHRSIPLGGNDFTKALAKERKVTFAEAEQLKRNATTDHDPAAVLRPMRPACNELATEIQRSIDDFISQDRDFEVEEVFALGNAMRLPGLRRHLADSLGEVVRMDEFRGLVTSKDCEAGALEENWIGFGVCYGLALQALHQAKVATNLHPSARRISTRLLRFLTSPSHHIGDLLRRRRLRHRKRTGTGFQKRQSTPNHMLARDFT
jgi:type IV pilus assembly protein PilM